MVALAGVGVVASLLIIVQARLISDAVSHVFATHRTDGVSGWAGLLALVFLGRAVLAWAGEVLAHRAAADVKSRLRHDLLAARLTRPQDSSLPTGTLVTLLTEGLDDLDGYYAKYLPQVLLAATVPLIVAVTIATQDVESAIIIAVTIPLIPVFMALIGWTTRAQVQRRLRVATRLANHFADLVTGLSTLQVFGRARAQLTGLRRSEDAHRGETMRTLRVTFLSSFVLELLATISVALVAVSVGFRVVFAEIDLRTALFILILAPEAYLPVRQVGVHFHDAADGMAAADAAFAVIEDAERAASPGTGAVPGDTTLVLDAVSHRYPDAPADALAPLSLALSPGEIVALAGPSGGGKSTALAVIAGFLRPTTGRVLVGGTP
ncbi:MAG TPA: ABC transporter transmembrane domain-containing protein, partial [Propionibacteriaceae bacterium]|nr:ABC transporter transmembrane domain-containing protein [Propionibacteriaceae bacterium]